ncbi:MAG: P27 family phage terminase small subunit, partial [Coriobacteriaceae bacterium]|nr:P27 family phage terminase small subunit [Coriobacteriaceae bacterium]
MPRGGVPRMARRLTKPASIRSDPWRSRKWNEIVRGRDLSPSDAPTIALLVSWYQVIEQCMDDIGANGEVQVAYQNDVGDIKALPKLSTMKQASAEIRALSRQLGLDVSPNERAQAKAGRAQVLSLVIADRKRKASQA